MDLLFIHHSCGGQLLADKGPQVGGEPSSGERCIYSSHPNGGGLRSALVAAGFAVNEASYGSEVGQDTDICHWSGKFRDHMDMVLRTQRQDELLPGGRANRVVVFKSCYPNNGFTGMGDEPGDPDCSHRTVANARAAYRSLLPCFAAHPEILFVALTAPPLVRPRPVGIMQKLKTALAGEPGSGKLARQFNTWLADTDGGWLAGAAPGNVAVFDYYDLLTGREAGDWSAYPTHDGRDSHPSAEGNSATATAFVSFLSDALRRQDTGAGRSA